MESDRPSESLVTNDCELDTQKERELEATSGFNVDAVTWSSDMVTIVCSEQDAVLERELDA